MHRNPFGMSAHCQFRLTQDTTLTHTVLSSTRAYRIPTTQHHQPARRREHPEGLYQEVGIRTMHCQLKMTGHSRSGPTPLWRIRLREQHTASPSRPKKRCSDMLKTRTHCALHTRHEKQGRICPEGLPLSRQQAATKPTNRSPDDSDQAFPRSRTSSGTQCSHGYSASTPAVTHGDPLTTQGSQSSSHHTSR